MCPCQENLNCAAILQLVYDKNVMFSKLDSSPRNDVGNGEQ